MTPDMRTGTQADTVEDTEQSLRLAAQRLVLDEAAAAMAKGDTDRFDRLVDRLMGHPSAAVLTAGHDGRRESRMDGWRLGLAAVLIVGLIAVVAISLTSDSQLGGDYIPLLSGLAGIAIGWLYSGSTARHLGGDGDGSR